MPYNTIANYRSVAEAFDALAPRGIQVLIEPLNPFDAPNYLVGSLATRGKTPRV